MWRIDEIPEKERKDNVIMVGRLLVSHWSGTS